MFNLKSQIKRYPLLPFSQLVYEMTRWRPDVYTMPLCILWHGGAKDQDKIENVLRIVLACHSVFQMRVDCCAQHYQTQLKDILHGRFHDFTFSKCGNDLIINIRFNRILGDGESLLVLVNDFTRVYKGETILHDRYWDYLEYTEEQTKTQHYLESSTWLKNEFADESIPIHPTLERHLWTILPLKAGLYKTDYSNLHEKINQLAETEFLSMDGFFSLCASLAIAEYCHTDAAALTWAYKGRERPEEQRIFGSLHRDIPFQINHISKIKNQKSELIRQARNQIRSGIAHSDYPFTLTKPYTNRWNHAVNVLRVKDENELIKLLPQSVELLPSSPQKYAYALLDVEIHESAERLEIVYRYSASHYKESSIRRFAALVRKYAEWLLE